MSLDLLYSVVIPVHNEAKNLSNLIREIEYAMHQWNSSWELILVDDGSTDTTSELIRSHQVTKPFIRLISLTKKCGQSNALACAFKEAQGEWIITLDGDGQNDPRDIPCLIERAAVTQVDMVAGVRRSRQDPFYKKVISTCANSIRRRLLSDNTTDTGCALKLFKKSCIAQIPYFNGMHRFLPALFSISGFSVKELLVHHRIRSFGKTKYTIFSRGLTPIMDMCMLIWLKKRALSYHVKD